MKLIRVKFFIGSFILISVLSIYIIAAGGLTFYFPTDPTNYFSHLSWSFLNGRLDLINPSWDRDLSFYNNRLFMYWGPTPIILILPLVLLFGIDISDVLYTAVYSSLSPLLIYLMLGKLETLGCARLSDLRKAILSLFFAFGTVYFSIAIRGGVWFTSQAISTLYILISLYLLFSYFTSKKIFYLILSSFFFGLAGWGRTTLFFYTPLFLALIYTYTVNGFNLKLFFKKTIPFAITLMFILILMGLYNNLRFGSVLENGYKYQNLALRFVLEKEAYGYFNFAYFWHNFYFIFINPPIISKAYPFLLFNPEGNSFLILSPLFLLFLLIFKREYWQNVNLIMLNSATLLCIFIIVFIQLNFWGTGWFQFNARYLLDIIPLLILLLAQTINKIHILFLLLLVIISVIFNTTGALWLTGAL